MDKFKVVERFFKGVETKYGYVGNGYRDCVYRYNDEVYYKFHNTIIAMLKNNVLIVYHYGFFTYTTADRLNLILRYADVPISVRMRMDGSRAHPILFYLDGVGVPYKLFTYPLVINLKSKKVLSADLMPDYIPAKPSYVNRKLRDAVVVGDGSIVLYKNRLFRFREHLNGYVEVSLFKKNMHYRLAVPYNLWDVYDNFFEKQT